jgi:SAM-dependent methyltransferase
MAHEATSTGLPGSELKSGKMPGHWLLARLGKRVLRPGGLELTRALLSDLAIGSADDVVELAPGLGVTARLLLEKGPRSYCGIERDGDAARWTLRQLPAGHDVDVRIGAAEQTGLADGSASVVIGEAMLTMNPQPHKEAIVAEAFRLLRPGGRYGVHELAVVPDDAPAEVRHEIGAALSQSIHVGARPMIESEWRALFARAGFSDVKVGFAPMHLLEPARMIADEGFLRTLMILKNLLLDPEARHRVLAMRQVFRKYGSHLSAISIVGRK